MTSALPVSTVHQPLGPGRLVLIVGPSGAGKDTLIKLAKELCPHAHYPPRVVTRPASAAENNEEMSIEAFDAASAAGEFAFSWGAHGLCYGVRRSVDADIGAGRTIVVNVSRAIVDDLRERYQDVTVVHVTAPRAVLEQRIGERARSSDGPIEQRLAREALDAGLKADVTIINTGSAEDAAALLARAIRGDE